MPELDRLLLMAERVRLACLTTASAAYEEAAGSGLCSAGAWEAARGAIEMLDLCAVIRAICDNPQSPKIEPAPPEPKMTDS